MPQNRSDIFTVSKLNRFAKHILESEIGSIWLSAEISNFVSASSGHWYFTLKDARSQVKAAMFKRANRRLKCTPKEGDKVLVRGDISIYEARGDYQLIASHLEPDGEGDLKAKFERLKAQLAAEGLFAHENKQQLPERPQKIAVITSPTGAAVRDIISVFKRRNPGIELLVYPSLVQGVEASAALTEAVKNVNAMPDVDAIIVGRGGGSMEDLWCFNDEKLARTIADSRLPIVSAVGHEIDFTICDFVADLRAATPTAAAELLSYSNTESLKEITALKQRLSSAIRHKIQESQKQLLDNSTQLQRLHPQFQIQQQWQRLDNLKFKLDENSKNALASEVSKLAQLRFRLEKQSPDAAITRAKITLNNLEQRLAIAIKNRLSDARQQLSRNCQLLDTVSPLATLSRGYSITFQNEQIVKSAADLQKGELIETRFKDGSVSSRVQ